VLGCGDAPRHVDRIGQRLRQQRGHGRRVGGGRDPIADRDEEPAAALDPGPQRLGALDRERRHVGEHDHVYVGQVDGAEIVRGHRRHGDARVVAVAGPQRGAQVEQLIVVARRAWIAIDEQGADAGRQRGPDPAAVVGRQRIARELDRGVGQAHPGRQRGREALDAGLAGADVDGAARHHPIAHRQRHLDTRDGGRAEVGDLGRHRDAAGAALAVALDLGPDHGQVRARRQAGRQIDHDQRRAGRPPRRLGAQGGGEHRRDQEHRALRVAGAAQQLRGAGQRPGQVGRPRRRRELADPIAQAEVIARQLDARPDVLAGAQERDLRRRSELRQDRPGVVLGARQDGAIRIGVRGGEPVVDDDHGRLRAGADRRAVAGAGGERLGQRQGDGDARQRARQQEQPFAQLQAARGAPLRRQQEVERREPHDLGAGPADEVDRQRHDHRGQAEQHQRRQERH
jgi:hypothetical protein